MEQDIQRYPLGLQTFSELKRMGCVYIDKTPYIWRMTHSSAKYNFLSRPRRFGKSLLVSTLHSYFAGERELFRGLLPLYVQSPENANDTLRKMKRSISGGDIDGALRALQT